MWQRFTETARKSILNAQEAAGSFGDAYVSPEHVLLGIIRCEDCLAVRILTEAGVRPNQAAHEVELKTPRGEGTHGQDMALSSHTKQVIDFACNEARKLQSNYVGTEHLLLGLLCQNDTLASRILQRLGITYDHAKHIAVEKQSLIKPAQQPLPSTPDEVLQNMARKMARLESEVERLTQSIMNSEKCKTGKSEFGDELRGRDLISISDLSSEDISRIFSVASELKSRSLDTQINNPVLPGKTLAMIFEKPSLRTRVTFEVGIMQLGGYGVYLQPTDIQLGKRESVPDIGQNLSRWVQGIMARTFAHKTITDLAEYASVPVINGLSDVEHPCQALADFLTIKEHKGTLKGLKLTYVGDGNNVCHSLMLLAAKVGMNMAVGCPEGYEPDAEITARAQAGAAKTGATIEIVHDPIEAVSGADAIYTDVWASMGQEEEQAMRAPIFRPYQVNQALVDAAKDDVIVLHCLPAHRGEEITDEVIDGPHAVVFDEAENRLHAQKAVMALVM